MPLDTQKNRESNSSKNPNRGIKQKRKYTLVLNLQAASGITDATDGVREREREREKRIR